MHPITPVIPGMPEVQIAKDQPEYNTLPAIVTGDGRVISRWYLSLRERLVVLFNGNIYLHQSTFHRPVQPVFMEVDEPKTTIDITEEANA